MKNMFSRLCFILLYFNPFFMENLKALIFMNNVANEPLSNQE